MDEHIVGHRDVISIFSHCYSSLQSVGLIFRVSAGWKCIWYGSIRFSMESRSFHPMLVVTVFLTTLPCILIDALYSQLKLALCGIPPNMLTCSNMSNSVPPPVRCSRRLASRHDGRGGASSADSTPGTLPRRRGPKRCGENCCHDAIDGNLLLLFCCCRWPWCFFVVLCVVLMW